MLRVGCAGLEGFRVAHSLKAGTDRLEGFNSRVIGLWKADVAGAPWCLFCQCKSHEVTFLAKAGRAAACESNHRPEVVRSGVDGGGDAVADEGRKP